MDDEATIHDTAPVMLDQLLMGEIRPGMWIGNLQSLKELSKLPSTKWTVISILKSEKLLHFTRTALQEISSCIETHVEWGIEDESQADFVSPKLAQVLTVIDEALENRNDAVPAEKRACLVHCAFGISRSAAICAAWLISRHAMTLPEALQEIRNVRPGASPNMGFIAGLRALEQCNGNIEAAIQRIRPRQNEQETDDE